MSKKEEVLGQTSVAGMFERNKLQVCSACCRSVISPYDMIQRYTDFYIGLWFLLWTWKLRSICSEYRPWVYLDVLLPTWGRISVYLSTSSWCGTFEVKIRFKVHVWEQSSGGLAAEPGPPPQESHLSRVEQSPDFLSPPKRDLNISS